MTQILDRLPPVTGDMRSQITAAPRTAEAHRALLSSIEAMNSVEVGGTTSFDALPEQLTVLAWNVERCLFPDKTADHIKHIDPQVVLLSEVDNGMARTAQRHTTRDVAEALGMTYVFGVEFHELDLGGPTERPYCTDDFNKFGWHGNAILSKVPCQKVAMVRLDDHGHWFSGQHGATDPDQPRVGGRMALLAVIPSVQGLVCFVSTHLESNAGVAHRHAQFAKILDAVEQFAPDMPVMIGGDLNTGNHLPPDFDWQRETLFDLASDAGYSWDYTAEGTTTRPSLITPHPDRVMKLDWLCGRDLKLRSKGILTSIGIGDTPLSDHDAVWARLIVA